MSKVEIPKTVKGVVIPKVGGTPVYGEVPMPELVEGDLLIQVAASPINPSDLSFLTGTYPSQRAYPCIAGNEGSGVIIAFKGTEGEKLIGKRVAFLPKSGGSLGAYGEYCIADTQSVFPIPDNVDLDQGACTFVNPFTVAYMLETVKSLGHKAVVHNVGASQLGQQMQRYFNDNGVSVINIVRRKEQVEQLKKNGTQYILNESEQGFGEQLNKLATELGAKIAFDAIGGEATSLLIKYLPNDSRVYNYGILSGEVYPKIDLSQLLFGGKQIYGYWLVREIANATKQKQVEIATKVSNLLGSTFATQVAQKVLQKDFQKGLEDYKKNMSSGKVLLVSPSDF